MSRLRSLPVQLLLLTILPLTALLVIVAFGGLSLHQRAMRQMVAERDERATRAAAAAIEEQLRRRIDALRNLTLHAQHVTPTPALDDSTAFREDFIGMAILASDGTLLAADELGLWAELMPHAVALSDHVAQAGDERFAADIVYRENGAPLMIALAGQPGEPAAVGAFDPAAIARDALSRVVLPGDHTAAYLVAPDGALLYQSGNAGHASAAYHPGVAEALRGEIGTTFMSVNGDEHVISFTPVRPVNWALVMEEPWREMTDPILRRTELAPFLLLPVLAVTLGLLWLGARQIVRPLQLLSGRTVALGQGNFEAVLEPVGGIREIRRLQAELVNMARRLQMSQQGLRDYLVALTVGQEEERRRLARDLHDETIQTLIALNQRLQLARTASKDEHLSGQLAEMETIAGGAIDDLRRLARDLRPSYLDDLGLAPALELLARDQSAELNLPVAFVLEGAARRLPPDVELAFYRIAQEALHNVSRHARASHTEVSLAYESDSATLAIVDDGVGFDWVARAGELALAGHYGLLGARERAEAVGARLVVETAPGRGTKLRVDWRLQTR